MPKVCNTCQKEQSLDQFHDRGRTVINCKTCRIAGIAVQDGSKKRSREFTKKYGIPISDYDEMLSDQQGQCAICKSTDPKGRWNRFCVDHDHVTGKVRGLLCDHCNRALGLLGDNIASLEAAIRYLHDYRNSNNSTEGVV